MTKVSKISKSNRKGTLTDIVNGLGSVDT